MMEVRNRITGQTSYLFQDQLEEEENLHWRHIKEKKYDIGTEPMNSESPKLYATKKEWQEHQDNREKGMVKVKN